MAFPLFPVLAILGAGAVLMSMGNKASAAQSAPRPSPTPTPGTPGLGIPVFVPPTVQPTSDANVDQMLRLAIAGGNLKSVVDSTLATQDPVKVWNLANAMDRVAAQGGSGASTAELQGAASLLRMQAMEMAIRQNNLDMFIARGIARGESSTMAQTARLVAARNPQHAQRLNTIADQLQRAPGVLAGAGVSLPVATDQAVAQTAAQAAAQVMAEAIKQTGQVLTPSTGVPSAPPATSSTPPASTPVFTSTSPGLPPVVRPAPAPVPSIVPAILPSVAPAVVPTPTIVLPQTVITAPAPVATTPALDPERVRGAQSVRDHLRNSMRYKEDRGRVRLFQQQEGLVTDGMYGPATATAIGKLGVVPVVPYYWSKATATRDKQVYKDNIAKLAAMFPHLDWREATMGGGPKNHPSVDRS